MPTQLFAGTLTQFDDSMAKAMEDALAALMGPLPSAPAKVVEDRRALFIAISRGVIEHLKAKQAAFEIDCDRNDIRVTAHPVIQVKP
jgi:hypothetical protein